MLSIWQQSTLSLITYLASLSLAGHGSLHQWPQNLERLKQGNWGPEASTGSRVERLLFLPASVRKKLKSYCFPSCQGLTVLLCQQCPWREHLLSVPAVPLLQSRRQQPPSCHCHGTSYFSCFHCGWDKVSLQLRLASTSQMHAALTGSINYSCAMHL